MLGYSIKDNHIITLDDDPLVSEILGRVLGTKSLSFATGRELLAHTSKRTPLAIFVDVNLSETELGITLIPEIKRRYPFTPIIVITATENEEALSESLALGADDFIRKPLSEREVVARLQRRLSERSQREVTQTLKVGDVVFSRGHHQLRGQGKKVSLTPTACRILEALVEAKGTRVTRDQVRRRGWENRGVSDNSIDRKIHEIRQALKATSRVLNLRVRYGAGFVLEVKQVEERQVDGSDESD